MHFTSFSLVALSFALPSLVSAHGYVASVSVNGKTYPGGTPGKPAGPVRNVNTVSPVTSTSDGNLACGPGAGPASGSAQASPGSTVQFHWVGGGGGPWPHVVGPVMTYMASCNGACSKFDASRAKWFKIDQQGKSGSTWPVHAGIKNGQPSSAKIPSNLTSGEYLIRNEIIGLQNAMSKGGAEFFPSCTQLKVGGNGSGKPSNTVSFPGGYQAGDKGLLYDAYTPGSGEYSFPGPSIATLRRREISEDEDDSTPETAPRALRFARNL